MSVKIRFRTLPRRGTRRAIAAGLAAALVTAACAGQGGDGESPTEVRDDDAQDTDEEATDQPEPASAYTNPGIGLEQRDSAHLPDDWDEVVAAAAEEGEVIIFTNQLPAVAEPRIAAFAEAFPDIAIREVRDSVDAMPTRFEQEHQSTGVPPADLLESSLFEALIADHPDWFLNLREDIDDAFIPTLNDYNRDVANPETRPRSVTSAAYLWSLVYNTDLVDEADLPQTWCELSDERWDSAGVMGDPRAATTYMALHSLILDDCGSEFGGQMMQHGWTWSDSVVNLTQQVAAGAYGVGFPSTRTHSKDLRDEGAPVAHHDLLPNEVGAITMALPKNAPNPNAQRVFATFILSAQHQEIQCEFGQNASLNQLAGGPCDPLTIPPDLQVMNLTIPEDERNAVLSAYGID